MRKLLFLILATISVFATNSYAQRLSDSETIATFEFVFGYVDIGTVTDEDKLKADFFIKELTQKSCALSLVEGLLVSPPYSVQKVIINLAKTVDCGNDLSSGKIYKIVRDQLNNNWKSAYAIRCQTGEW